MIVMKFGGISIQDPIAIFRSFEITRHHVEHDTMTPIIVCSAMGKTTRQLLEIAQLAAAGHVRDAKKKLTDLLEYHVNLAEQLYTTFTSTQEFKNIQIMVNDIQSYILKLNNSRELTPELQDHLLAYGELISTNIIFLIYQEGGMECEWVDARKCIITNDEFTRARPDFKKTYEMIKKAMLPIIEKGRVPITQGFIGSTDDGRTTTLGFEGSDFTAAMIGAALYAEEIQIWKDVDGVLTTDPILIDNVRLVPYISYAEAEELTYFGAKVLHPRTLEPAKKKNIPIFVKNASKALDTGTRIAQTVPKSLNPVKSITYKKDITVIQIQCEKSQQQDLIKKIHGLLEQPYNYPLISYSDEAKLSLVMETQVLSKRIMVALGALGAVHLLENKSSITLVGEGVGESTETIQAVIDVLSGTKMDIILDKTYPLSVNLIVDKAQLIMGIEKLHARFFNG